MQNVPCKLAIFIIIHIREYLGQTPSSGLRHPSLEEGAGKGCSECVPGVVVRLCYKLLTVTGKVRRWFRSALWTGIYLGTCSSLSSRMPPAPPSLETHNATSYHHRHWNHTMQLHITTGTGITQCNFISSPYYCPQYSFISLCTI